MSNRTLSVAIIDSFADYLRREERAPATIEKYLRDIRSFADWLDNKEVSKENTSAWKDALQSEGLAPSTINAKLSAVNSMLRYLGWEDCRVKFLKCQRKAFRDSSKDLSRDEYNRLLETATHLGLEKSALLLESICATGMRVSEVKFLTVESLQSGYVEISLKGKIRTILLPNKLCRKLLKYAKKQKITSGAIFRTKDGAVLSRFQIWRMLKNLCAEANVDASKVFPHNLRHLFATTFYKATKDIVKLADILGHSSVNTTRIYLISTGVEHMRQIERLGLVS